jgi:hypothetical protein
VQNAYTDGVRSAQRAHEDKAAADARIKQMMTEASVDVGA